MTTGLQRAPRMAAGLVTPNPYRLKVRGRLRSWRGRAETTGQDCKEQEDKPPAIPEATPPLNGSIPEAGTIRQQSGCPHGQGLVLLLATEATGLCRAGQDCSLLCTLRPGVLGPSATQEASCSLTVCAILTPTLPAPLISCNCNN
ncbi:dynein heavy chain domain-containing protein 1-like [Platysternon megacephalum]|uniref:Dynein heavy chain domain-containing protein 1-like n=1 Tax=Platysternon megacephalum TaxID=55544 RepID=A0A4D9DHQ8_9SAUR|nr:dynein heavy chain domain-containing protein 1-like [Platysternon megacephalum]